MPNSFSAVFCSIWFMVMVQSSSLIAQHPAWHNFTVNDGLRSNEVYSMLEDRNGFLWIATDQGICRFNGYEFTRPVDTSVAATGSVFKMVEDQQGRIYFNHLDPVISILEHDTVHLWQHNDIFNWPEIKSNYVGRLAIDEEGALWIPLRTKGFLIVQPNGEYRTYPVFSQTTYIFAEVGSHTLCGQVLSKNIKAETDFMHQTGQTSEIAHLSKHKKVDLGRLPINWAKQASATGSSAWRLRNGDFIFRMNQTFYLIRDDRMIWYGVKEVYANNLTEDAEGNILLGAVTGANKGLLRYRSLEHFKRDEFENILPDHAVSGVLCDREGGIWASTTDAGLFYCKNPALKIFDVSSGLPSNNVSCLTSDGLETVFAGINSRNITAIHTSKGTMEALPELPVSSMSELTVLNYDTLTKWLWCGPNLSYFSNNRWNSIHINLPVLNGDKVVPIKKMSLDPRGDRWWLSSTYGFYSLDRRTGAYSRIANDSLAVERTFTVSADAKGKIWVTKLQGLQLWATDHYEPVPFSHPALRYPARNTEILPKGGIVIALRGGGLLIQDELGRFEHITIKNGLAADWISHLLVSPQGLIYACSNAGMSILSPNPNGHWSISTLSTKHGLPSNQVNDVLLFQDELWVATDRGIACFRQKPNPAPMPAPLLEKFLVDGQIKSFSNDLQLNYDQNNISLSYFSLHYRSEGNILYQYRLHGVDTNFVRTHTREVNFSNLSPGEYAFEVQAQNEDGHWSPSAVWSFCIQAPWWATWWFQTLAGILIVGLGYVLYQSRLKAIQKEAAEKEKIRELETAALRAQMNPHFIYNCLQAIQSFIAQNDPSTASGYLARFAKLVRLALHGSVDGHHTLMEEKSMLENYLYLEQMRFKGKFDFEVRIAPGIDEFDTLIPPLLVQPFVENAVVHGLQDKAGKGRVEVLFSKKGDHLEVTVTDNGKGLYIKEKGLELSGESHKSVGMMLTKKRLDLLAGLERPGEALLSHENISNEDGMVTGMRVRILVPIIAS